MLICKPAEPGKDFNDVLREKGVAGVRLQMNTLVLYEPISTQVKKATLDQGKNREKKFGNELERGI